ncbi:MAG: sel1 repeat family protein [Deltaproteobacteria bacterium]|nr:sel1 repeat family protein [Deltaproteobacteria bacterium]
MFSRINLFILTVAFIISCSHQNKIPDYAYKIGKGDYQGALTDVEPLAQEGDPYAQYTLGVMFAKGHGVPHDYKKALKWCRLAAEQGLAPAQFVLGDMYFFAQGVQKNLLPKSR